MMVQIEQSLYCGVSSTVELPDGITIDDMRDTYIKWDVLHFNVKGKAYEIDLGSDLDSSESIDYKRPQFVTVYAQVNGEVDYEVDYAKQLRMPT